MKRYSEVCKKGKTRKIVYLCAENVYDKENYTYKKTIGNTISYEDGRALMEEKLVSVIVPVYKTEQYLEQCMKSILEQDYPALEIILVDDGSPDQCPHLCDAYAEKYEMVQVIHQENKGLGLSRNSGMAAAHGTYITFVDSDDCLEPSAIRRMVVCAEKNQADITVGGFRRFHDHGVWDVNIPHLYTGEDSRTVDFRFKGFYMYGHLAYNWGKLYRKSFLDAHDLKCRAYPFTQDKAHNMACYAYRPKYAFLDDSVYLYRVNESSVTFRYKENLMPVWISIAADFEQFLKERKIKNRYGDLIAFHLFFGSFFLVKQELQAKKHGIWESAKVLKAYGKHPLVRDAMRDLARTRYTRQIKARKWKIVISSAAFLFHIHAYHLFAFGIFILRKLDVDGKITASRYKGKQVESEEKKRVQ